MTTRVIFFVVFLSAFIHGTNLVHTKKIMNVFFSQFTQNANKLLLMPASVLLLYWTVVMGFVRAVCLAEFIIYMDLLQFFGLEDTYAFELYAYRYWFYAVSSLITFLSMKYHVRKHKDDGVGTFIVNVVLELIVRDLLLKYATPIMLVYLFVVPALAFHVAVTFFLLLNVLGIVKIHVVNKID